MSRKHTPAHDTVGGPEAPKVQRIELSASHVLHAARWLAGSTLRRHPTRMAFIAVAQVFGAVGTALGTIAVLFYIRAAIGDGTLGRLNIEIESAAEPGTAVLFLTSIIACLLYTSPSPRDQRGSRMPSSA